MTASPNIAKILPFFQTGGGSIPQLMDWSREYLSRDKQPTGTPGRDILGHQGQWRAKGGTV
jgi:hypothetical protein